MDAGVSTRTARAAGVLASSVAVLLGAGASDAAARPTQELSSTSSRQVAVVPSNTTDPGDQTATTPTTTTPDTPARPGTDIQDPVTDPSGKVGQEIRKDPGYANAATQSPAAKLKEATQDCVGARPPNSKMLGIGGVVAGDHGTSWNGLVIVIAVAALLIAITAFLIRRHRSPSGAREPRGALEIISTMIAIIGGVVGLAVQFIPGIGIEKRPPPQATMQVRDVQARITHGEFATKTRAGRLPKIDQRQVGNVIWLEIALQGYAGKHAELQYAMYDPHAGGALLPRTEGAIKLPIEDKDSQQSFVPVWVGYPKSPKFTAQFRLLVDNEVRQIADTGGMHGSKFRYSC